MTSGVCRIFYRNINTPLLKVISTKLRVPSMALIRHCSHAEQPNQKSLNQGAFAEFYEKTKENKQATEEDQDFEILLRNSNLINVI